MSKHPDSSDWLLRSHIGSLHTGTEAGFTGFGSLILIQCGLA